MWYHELVYTPEGEPVTYELITLSQFVTGYLSVLDTVKSGERQVMLKHYELTTGCGTNSLRMGGLSGRTQISSWSLDML